jgi:ABC-type dipeptide/oligopeptide/nickel transport system permease component
LFTLWLVFTIVFVASRLSGDPIQLLYPDGLSPEAEATMREYLGARQLPY